MSTFRRRLRRIFHGVADAFARSAPYLFAIDPSRPPPPAVWPSAWRLEPPAESAHERPPAAECCGCCG